MTVYVAPVVEGQTEQGCVERLLQRTWGQLLGRPERLQVLEPFRRPRGQLVQTSGAALAKAVQEAHLKLRAKVKRETDARSMVLVLIDAEDECPATLAPRLLFVARTALPPDINSACVIAKRMLENWIVVGASTLAGVNGLPDPLPARDQFEERSGAAWLEGQLRSRNAARKYKKTVDAEAFVRAMDLHECRLNSPSFDKLCRDLVTFFPPPPVESGHTSPPDTADPGA
jgi:hypothetical protein